MAGLLLRCLRKIWIERNHRVFREGERFVGSCGRSVGVKPLFVWALVIEVFCNYQLGFGVSFCCMWAP